MKQIKNLKLMGGKKMFGRDYDRVDVNESDGMVFYGYDDHDSGTTTWYTEDGSCDCVTATPDDDY